MAESDTLLAQHLAQTTPWPMGLHIESAKGIYIYDKTGKPYLDLVSGIGVSHLGHGHPHITQAIGHQLEKHLHVMVYGEYVQQAQLDAARELCALLPTPLDTCYFVNSGAEATEAALKLARRATGRKKIISFHGAYHGSTLGALSVSGNKHKREVFEPLLPGVHFIQLNKQEELSLIDNDTACVILETIQGDAGVRIPEVEFMQALRLRCNETGTLLILDEIQCGLGRSGSVWAFEQFGIVPDLLTLGKALGGGMPIGCLVAPRQLMELFTHHPSLGHISTFAGHPLVCAAAAAALQVFKTEINLAEVNRKGQWMATQLRQHPAVREVRQRGLFFAIDLDDENVVQRTVEHNLQNGLVSFWFLSCPASFRIAPPLNISEDEMVKAVDIILHSLGEAVPQS